MEPPEKEISKENLVVTCPHCQEIVLIEKLNCCIFRHGVLKQNGKQIEPHLCKEKCDKMIINNLIYGCGKPFFVRLIEGNYIAEICDYI
jgi:hypothetical protein